MPAGFVFGCDISVAEQVNSQSKHAQTQHATGPCQTLSARAQGTYGGDDLCILLGQLFDDLQRLEQKLPQVGNTQLQLPNQPQG